jgi:hypothetical protein
MSRVGLQIDAVDLKRIEGVFHIAAGGLNVRQRHEPHGAEFTRMIGHHLRHYLITGLDQPFCEFDIAEIGSRRGDRHEYGIDSEFAINSSCRATLHAGQGFSPLPSTPTRASSLL